MPIGILIHRGVSPWRPVMLTPGLAIAFSTRARASDFLAAAGHPTWEVRLVTRHTKGVLIEKLLQQGVLGIVLDPNADGDGTTIEFRNMELA